MADPVRVQAVGLYPTQVLPAAQAAALEEQIRQMELEDICCQTEETQAYWVCRLLDHQGKKAQCRQEEALREMFESGRKSNFALLSLHWTTSYQDQ